MKKNPIPTNELERLKALESYAIMDTSEEKEYDSITQLASYICETPTALVSLIDSERLWIKSKVGLNATEIRRDISICQYTIMDNELFEVNDTLNDETFVNTPLVTGYPNIRYYAGVPLKDANGYNLGTLCVVDTKARTLTANQKNALKILASQVVVLLQFKKNNEELINSKKEFQSFFELSPDLVCISDSKGIFKKVNPAFTTILGYSKEEVEGKLFTDFVHPNDLKESIKVALSVLAGEKVNNFENRNRSKNGNYLSLSWNFSIVPQTENIYAIARDITDIKIAEKKVLDKDKEVRDIRLALDESAIVAITDVNGIISYVNDKFCSISKYRNKELIGQNHNIVKSGYHSEEFFSIAMEILNKGKVWNGEIKDKAKDGSYYWVNTTIVPFLDEKGKPYQFVVISTDITDRKFVEEELEESRERYRGLSEATFEAIFISENGFGIEQNENAEKMFGYTAQEIIGVQATEIIAPEYRKLVHQHYFDNYEGSYEAIALRKNGDTFPCTIHGKTMYYKGRNVRVTSFTDISKRKQVEIALKESEQKSRLLLDSTSQGIYGVDLHGNCTFANASSIKMFGFEKEEDLLGKHVHTLVHHTKPDGSHYPSSECHMYKALQNHIEVHIADESFWRKDGTSFPVEYWSHSIINNGKIVGAVASFYDITERIKAEEEIRITNERYNLVSKATNDSIWDWNLLTDEIVRDGEGFKKMFGYDQKEIQDVAFFMQKIIYPEDYAKIKKSIFKALNDPNEHYWEGEFKIRNISGEYLYVFDKGYIIRDEKGKAIRMIGATQNIDGRKKSELALKDSLKVLGDYKFALDQSAIVAITDNKGIILSVNDKFCGISKYSKEELIGNSHAVVNSKFHNNNFFDMLWKTISSGKVWNGEIKNKSKDGKYYWVNSTIIPFLDNKGIPYQYIAIHRDITSRKGAEENLNSALIGLEKNNKELDQFAYVVSHDLKAPLRAINNLAEWIMEDMPEMPEDVNKNFTILRGRIERMENLINGVLEYSRIGRKKIEKEHVDTREMLQHITDSIVPNVGFKIFIDENLPLLFVEEILIEQVFTNLISNAVKYNNKPIGEIKCMYKSLPNYHQFIISDNGPGISSQYHVKIFEIFQTIESRDRKESTGIGLSIVKKIIEEKGGAIYIESGEESGASFIFTIPK